MLVETNRNYVERVEGSKHFLNCPKHILNHTLDCFYRQFHDNKAKAIEVIHSYLKDYNIESPKQKAIQFVEWRSSITIQEFNNINVNSYVDNSPKHINDMLNHQCNWIETNTTYFPFTGIKNKQPSYPYKFRTL